MDADNGTLTSEQTFASTAIDNVDGAVGTLCDYPSPYNFTSGNTTVTCNATDAMANVGTCQFLVNVKGIIAVVPYLHSSTHFSLMVWVFADYLPPNMTCPNSIVGQDMNTGLETFELNWTVAVADDGDPNPSVACSPVAPYNFSLGNTSVTW